MKNVLRTFSETIPSIRGGGRALCDILYSEMRSRVCTKIRLIISCISHWIKLETICDASPSEKANDVAIRQGVG